MKEESSMFAPAKGPPGVSFVPATMATAAGIGWGMSEACVTVAGAVVVVFPKCSKKKRRKYMSQTKISATTTIVRAQFPV